MKSTKTRAGVSQRSVAERVTHRAVEGLSGQSRLAMVAVAYLE